MSSVPPYTPPIPPYDPKTQWRIHREQQRAAWRAQRDAMKAHRQVWKASYINAYGPRVPSVVGPVILIGIGVIALLVATGRIAASQFWAWYTHWWPLLLIAAGLALLGEWALDLRRPSPVRRSGSFIGILILLAILGICAAGWNHARPWFTQLGDSNEYELNDDFLKALGMPEHDFDRSPLSAQIPANAMIEIQNPHGDIRVTAGEGSSIEVQTHEIANAGSDAEARKIFEAEAPFMTMINGVVLLKSNSSSNGRINLTVTVPKTARVTIDSGKGDVIAAGLGAGLQLTARGDVQLTGLTGSVAAHLAGGRHDFSIHQLDGDLTVNGDCDDFTLSEIKGRVTQNGDILGDAHLETVSGPVHLHTSVTDLELAELPGDLALDSDNLRVNQAKGQVRVVTHSKDIDLSQIYGDSTVEDRNGSITIEPAGTYSVDAKNSKGDVEITLPPNAAATIDGRTHNGDIVTEFGLPVSGEENKTVTGKIGSGASRIVLATDNGDLRIKKGSGFSAAPSVLNPPPKSPAAPGPPAAPNALHLKAPKVPPSQPVTQ